MDKLFYNTILDLIPSRDLRDYVKSNDFCFKEKDLLNIILEYSPTLNKRLTLFEEAEKLLDDRDMRKLAKKRIDFEKRQYDAFIKAEPNTVYEIEIKIDPYIGVGDTYITTTFDAAILFIKKYLNLFKVRAKESINARYTIKKKATVLPNKKSDFYRSKVGTVGECVLNNNFDIISLDMYGLGVEMPCKKRVSCDECQRCVRFALTRFPHFLKKYELVAYYDDLKYNPSSIEYGIFMLDMEECDDDTYVVPIEDNDFIKNNKGEVKTLEDYGRICDAHQHPPYYTIIKPEIKSVPKKVYEDYLYIVNALKTLEEK